VSIDGGAAQAISINGSATFAALTAGSHTVTLSGLAPNCTVSGANPQPVSVTAGATTTSSFAVSCAATTGDLTVNATTTGTDLDPDGYAVTVDGGAPKAITVNGTAAFPGLSSGPHAVALTSLAPNCTTTSPQTATIVAGAVTTASFTVTCVTTHGDLTVNAATTGAELDPDGYGVSVDGGSAQPIGVNGSLSFTALSAGSHTLTLSGLASNCTVNGVNPQTVTIVAGATTTSSFAMICAATTGSLTVTTATTGADLDQDGYSVTVDGNAAGSQAVTTTGSVTFAALLAGSHTVGLSGLAPNCTAAANPQTTSVVAGSATTLGFTISCLTTHGDLKVTTSTTGVELDPDGYAVSLDGGAPQTIAGNGSVTFPALTAGSHSVTLSGLAANCTVSGANPQTVTAVAGTTTTTSFAVSCVATTGALTVTTATTGTDLDPDGYAVSVDGGAPRALGINATTTFGTLSAGSHTVTLSGLAVNCSAAANPQTATVVAGATRTLGFAVTCVTLGNYVVALAAGDIVRCTLTNAEKTAKIIDTIPNATVMALGDNAYENGTLTEFTTCYEPTWGRHKARTRPATGNHEYNTPGATGYYQYFGAAAGDPSKGYYSYDLGAWHVVVLNSSISAVTGSPQEQWLRQDLAAHPAQCTLAYWHHPRFNSGEVGNNIKMQPLWQALYDYGADVILSAHEHLYERFAPQTPTGTSDPVKGIRQFTIGTGGAGNTNAWGTIQPNSEVRYLSDFGVLKLTLYQNSYAWKFITVSKVFEESGSGTCH
jgi:hypothetical protein